MKSILPRLSFLLLLINCVEGQNLKSVSPGDNLLDGSIISDYTNKWKVTYVDAGGNKTPNRIWTDYGQLIELDGKKYFHRVQDLYSPQMELQETWINMVEFPSLKPVSFSRNAPTGKFTYLQFDGKEISGKTNYQADGFDPTTIDASFETAVFDWNLYGMLLIGLPFEEGLSYKIPFYSNQTNSLDWMQVDIVRNERLKSSDGKDIDTWVISTDQNLTFWLTKTAPYVHKLELNLQNNSKLVWDTF